MHATIARKLTNYHKSPLYFKHLVRKYYRKYVTAEVRKAIKNGRGKADVSITMCYKDVWEAIVQKAKRDGYEVTKESRNLLASEMTLEW